MKRGELVRVIEGRISEVYDPSEARCIALMAAGHLTGLDRTQLLSDPGADAVLDSGSLEEVCRRLENSEPVQYVIGDTEFYGSHLEVMPGVLIPRPETEELVRWIVDDRPSFPPHPSVLDVGTGSGAIAVALAKHIPGARVCAWDISPVALQIARRNAELNGVTVTFVEADVLNPGEDDFTGAPYDIIVSNPPYIPLSARRDMSANVTRYEPEGALFVPDDDPLLFYRGICLAARRALSPGGALYLEIHEEFGGQVCALMERQGFTGVVLRSDINGKPRMVRCMG